VSYANDPPWNKFVHSAWIHSGATCYDSDWVSMVKANMVLTGCNELSNLAYRQSVLFFEGQNYKFHNNVIQFTTMGPSTHINAEGLLWPESGLASLVKNNPELLAPKRHPNERGHEVIRNHLIPEIERVILA